MSPPPLTITCFSRTYCCMSGIAVWLCWYCCCFVHYLHFLSPLDVAGCCDVILRSYCLSSGCVWMWLNFPCVLCNESVENGVSVRQVFDCVDIRRRVKGDRQTTRLRHGLLPFHWNRPRNANSGVKSQNIGVYSF